MAAMCPTLPYSSGDRLNHIPAPEPEEFDSMFGGLLPEGVSIPSSWGHIRCYQFPSTSSSTGHNVVLLHGGGTPALGMVPLAQKLLANGHNVVAYDLWSHGLSSTPLAAHTPALFHTQLLEVLSYFGWTSAHILGFSIGGSIAATFASTHPRAVDSLVLAAPSGLLRKAARPWLDSIILEGGWGREWLSRRKIMSFVNGSDPKVDPHWKEMLREGKVDSVAIEKWERETHLGHVAGTVSIFRYGGVYDEHESFRLLEQTKVKKLIILAEQDKVVEQDATKSELRKVGWSGSIRTVEGADHGFIRSHAGNIAEIVEEFWRNLHSND